MLKLADLKVRHIYRHIYQYLKIRHIYQYGIIIGLSLFLLNIAVYYSAKFIFSNYIYILLGEFVIILILLVITIFYYKEKNSKVSYKSSLSLLILIGCISSFTSFFCFSIYLNIDGSMLNEMFFFMVDALQTDKLTDAETNQLIKTGEYFLNPLGFSFFFKGILPFFIIFILSFFISIFSIFNFKRS